MATILRDQGVDIILNAHVERISHHENQVQVHSEHAQLAVDALLIASGRQPATASLHPENAGAVNERGAIVVDKRLHTTADNIWAMGDVTGGLQFTYISLDDYRIVRDELLGEGKRSTDDGKMCLIPYL
jgi:pyruvate/2-oxoglutarate dehydrogenase complex dihydrolipoamide dehydrogenase (E3) component